MLLSTVNLYVPKERIKTKNYLVFCIHVFVSTYFLWFIESTSKLDFFVVLPCVCTQSNEKWKRKLLWQCLPIQCACNFFFFLLFFFSMVTNKITRKCTFCTKIHAKLMCSTQVYFIFHVI